MKNLITVIGFLFFFAPSFSQWFSVYEAVFEFEAQRYLMNEIYEISSTNVDELRIDHIYSENDGDFILRLTAYEFNGNRGVVLTSLNSHDVIGDLYKFRNIHFTKEEFEELNNRLSFMSVNQRKKDVILLQRLNERLIFEVSSMYAAQDQTSYNLWIDNTARHRFTKVDWVKSFQRFQEFFQK